MKLKTKLPIILIIALALFLRLFRLDWTAIRLTQDEMSLGYNAYSIAVTGKDEWGRSFPLVFEAFGDYKQPAYVYLTVPWVKILGITPLATKLPSVVAGTISIIGIYYLTKLIFKNESMALVAGLVAGMSPMPIQLSRSALESNLALAFFIWGLVFGVRSLQKKGKLSQMLAGLCLGLTFYSYISYRLIVGLIFVATIIFIIKNRRYIKQLSIALVTFIIILIPIINLILGQSGLARFSQISTDITKGNEAYIEDIHNLCFLVDPSVVARVCRVVVNKPTVMIFSLAKSYISFLSPSFLFIQGDSTKYLSNPSFPEFYMFLLPFYILGLVGLMKRADRDSRLLLMGLLLAPIPASLVGEPQIVRGSAMVPFVAIIISLGMASTYKWLKSKPAKHLLSLVIIILGVVSTGRYLFDYYFVYPVKYDSFFYELGQEVAVFAKDNESNYEQIVIEDFWSNPHILFAFYQQIDPKWYLANVIRPDPDKYGFSHPTAWGKYQIGTKTLSDFVCSGQDSSVLFFAKPDPIVVRLSGPEKTYTLGPIETFYNFSKVHAQAKAYDVNAVRMSLEEAGFYEAYCQ